MKKKKHEKKNPQGKIIGSQSWKKKLKGEIIGMDQYSSLLTQCSLHVAYCKRNKLILRFWSLVFSCLFFPVDE